MAHSLKKLLLKRLNLSDTRIFEVLGDNYDIFECFCVSSLLQQRHLRFLGNSCLLLRRLCEHPMDFV